MSAQLTQAESAAVLVMLLDDAHAADLLARLGPAELKRLGEAMFALGDIGPEFITNAVERFVAHTEQQGIAAHGRSEKVEALFTQAVGDVKASNLMQAIRPDASGPALELVRWLSAEALIPLVIDEHPQALAVLMVQLDPEIAARILYALPPKIQTDVVHRIATLGPVPETALEMLEQLLEARIAAQHGAAMLKLGGARQAADIINQAGKAAEKRIMPELARLDRQLAKTIENEMFKFEHLFVLDGQQMGTLLREIESDVLINALKGIEEEQREVFFRAMSSRAADGVRDEIATRGRLKVAEVVDAQREIVAVARRLAADGAIVFGAGGEDEYV